MVSTVASRVFSDRSAGFLYLLPITFVYIYSVTQQPIFVGLGIVSLMSSVFVHGFIKGIAGPGGFASNPLRRDEKKRRAQAVIWDIGGSDDYTANLTGGMLASEHRSRSRVVVLVFLVLSLILTTIGYIAGVGYMIQLLPELDFIGLVLLFALVLWLSQIVLWIPWSSVYLKEQRVDDRTDHRELLRKEMDRFVYFVAAETPLVGTHADYKPSGGAVSHIEFDSQNEPGQIETESLETIAQGYVSFLERIEFPVEELHTFVKFDDGSRLQFKIESEWVTDYQQQKIEFEDYRDTILRTMRDGKSDG